MKRRAILLALSVTVVASTMLTAPASIAAPLEVTEQAEQAWIDLLDGTGTSIFGNLDCTPGYYNNEGKPMGRRERLGASGYPAGPVAYFAYIENWRSNGEFAGLEFLGPAQDHVSPPNETTN